MDIGEKIKNLRIQKNLTQEELANRCELSKGFISQVENNITSPSIATLIDILETLGKLNTWGIYYIHDAHEGEEFGYVLKGKISLYYGNEKYILKKGESFYYKPSKTHYIKNDSKSSSEVLWVSTPPSF